MLSQVALHNRPPPRLQVIVPEPTLQHRIRTLRRKPSPPCITVERRHLGIGEVTPLPKGQIPQIDRSNVGPVQMTQRKA